MPQELTSERLLLRRWRVTDAAALQPILEANADHLRGWIPAHVAKPAPVDQLVERLRRFSVAFDDAREWRYAVFTSETPRLLGEVGLFPRAASGRVTFAAADHIEIGYWLRSDATRQGFATEATRAAMDIVFALTGISRVAIRCDERNAPSAALARRLGFELIATESEADGRLQVWERQLSA